MNSTLRLRLVFIGMLAISIFPVSSVPRLRTAVAGARPANEATRPTPVLIELFTSEGCSSCPPADALLAKLDRGQPVAGAGLIVLSEHVDYWNDGGWNDPYSSHAYSERQNAYAEHFGLPGVYTPQMVVDGRQEFVGSDERRAIRAVSEALRFTKIAVKMSATRREGRDTVGLHLDAEPLPSDADANAADILIAVADESDESSISGGENGGRTLRHVAVLRSLSRIGSVGKSGEYSHHARIHVAGLGGQTLRLIAIVQDSRTGRVWGADFARLSY